MILFLRKGILFVCVNCRIKGRADTSAIGNDKSLPGSALFKQLHEMLSALCQSVSALLSRVQELESAPRSALPAVQTAEASDVTISAEGMRQKIREEVREMEERSKRKDFIVIRGLICDSNLVFCERFAEISTAITGRSVAVSDVALVNREKKVYRAKIVNPDERRLILDSSKKLKSISAFSNIYINRDLTFVQRQELFQRRSSFGRSARLATAEPVVPSVVVDASSQAEGLVTGGSTSPLAHSPNLQGRQPSPGRHEDFLTSITLK